MLGGRSVDSRSGRGCLDDAADAALYRMADDASNLRLVVNDENEFVCHSNNVRCRRVKTQGGATCMGLHTVQRVGCSSLRLRRLPRVLVRAFSWRNIQASNRVEFRVPLERLVMTKGLLLSLMLLVPATLVAQSHDDMAGMPMHDQSAQPLSAAARKEIDSVARQAAPLATTAAAASAGFHPVFGWIPTMGEHWVDRALMTRDKQLDRSAPANLMFSKIDGRDSLVGVAYAYFAPLADSTPPRLFDGAPAWHEHPNLAPPGERLLMLHVWFVPSPDGAFAGTNPNLPFWAAGLSAPDSARMRNDSAFNGRVRRASLALAEVTDTSSIFPNLERRPDLQPVLAAHRDSIRAIVAELRVAEKTHDTARWDGALDRAAAQWDAIYDAYLASARTPQGRQHMERFIDMLLGHHHG